jgi:hypothetical protein
MTKINPCQDRAAMLDLLGPSCNKYLDHLSDDTLFKIMYCSTFEEFMESDVQSDAFREHLVQKKKEKYEEKKEEKNLIKKASLPYIQNKLIAIFKFIYCFHHLN